MYKLALITCLISASLFAQSPNFILIYVDDLGWTDTAVPMIKDDLKTKSDFYQTPHLASDGIIKLYNQEDEFQGIVLIQRLNEPKGIAIPGGFVDIGESVEEAVIREMKEEVSIDVTIEKLQGVYSKPNRDKRFHCVSCVFECISKGIPKAADDAKEVYIYKLEDIPYEKLVFDHEEILRDFVKNFNAHK